MIRAQPDFSEAAAAVTQELQRIQAIFELQNIKIDEFRCFIRKLFDKP